MRRRRLTSLSVLALLALAFSAGRAAATTIIPVSDRDLALSSRAIVEGTVVDAEPLWDAERRAVYTYVTVDVVRTLKGDVPPGLVVLKQIGGSTARHATTVHGAPSLSRGDRALLFLNTDRRGALRIAHLSLGHYAVVPDPETGRDLVVRALDAEAASAEEAPAAVATPRDEFVAAIAATLEAAPEEAAGYEAAYGGTRILLAPPEYVASAPSGPPTANFEFLDPPMRWFEPDTGVAVGIKVNPRGAPTPSRGVEEAKAAMAAWSEVSGASLRLVYAGQSSTAGRFEDGVSAITFGDPAGELDNPVNCSGVVAIGGVTKADGAQTVTVGGTHFARILEADIVVNDGFDCALSDSAFLSEILTHELGHVLGFGHSSQRQNESRAGVRDATMYFIAHDDDRGASLRVDDSQGVRSLYPGDGRTGPLEIKTDGVPDARAGAPYSVYLRAGGGTTPRVWEVVGGSLPGGLRLSQDGHVYGVPGSAAESVITVRVRDAAGAWQSRDYVIAASASPAPHLSRAAFKANAGKLVLTGSYLGAGAAIILNGEQLSDGAVVKFKAAKGRLVATKVARSAVRPAGENTVSVVVDGRQSNTVTF